MCPVLIFKRKEVKNMKNTNVVKTVTAAVVGCISTITDWMFGKLGILFYVLMLLALMMFIDYITGMLASKKEALEHPGNANYGWNSKKGALGIIKKVGYLFIIVVALAVDYIILYVAADMGMELGIKAFFGLLVAVWYLLNELLSIVENAGRMGADVPVWLTKYIAVLKNKIDSQTEV